MSRFTRRAGFGLWAGVALAGGIALVALAGLNLGGTKPEAEPLPANQAQHSAVRAEVASPEPGSPRSFRYRPAWRDNWETAQAQIAALQKKRQDISKESQVELKRIDEEIAALTKRVALNRKDLAETGKALAAIVEEIKRAGRGKDLRLQHTAV